MSPLMAVLAGYEIVLMMTGITPLNVRPGKISNCSGRGWKRMHFMTIITAGNRFSFLRIMRHESVRGDLLSARCYIFGTRCCEFIERSMTIQTDLFGDRRCRCGGFSCCDWGTAAAGTTQTSSMIIVAMRNKNRSLDTDANLFFIILLLQNKFHNKLHRLFQ